MTPFGVGESLNTTYWSHADLFEDALPHACPALLFFQAAFYSAMETGQGQTGLESHAILFFDLAYQCGVLSSELSDSKEVYLQSEDENELQKISKWREEACFYFPTSQKRIRLL